MTMGTPPKSPLDGLVICGSCGAPIDFEGPGQGREARYACNGNHECRRNPLRVPADWADRLIIGSILVAVLTDNGISTVKSAITKPDEAENAGRAFPGEDVGLLREDPYFFLQSVRTMENARNFLATFITRVKLFPDRAVVHYAMPLPADSHLAGATKQEVPLSANLVN